MKTAPLNRELWKQAVLDQFEKMKAHTEPYEIQLGDKSLTVLPNVFSPKYFTDSLWFAEQISDMVGTKSLLEIGTGTGITSLFAALGGAKVVATDVNPDAVKNAQLNFKKFGLDVSTREGSLYSPIKEGEKFDFIFWNHPFNNWETPVTEVLLRAGLDYQYKDLADYIRDARKHLAVGGKLLLGTGNNADIGTIEKLAKENGYSLNLLQEEVFPVEDGSSTINSYIIYEFVEA